MKGVVAMEKETSRQPQLKSTSTKVANFTLYYLYFHSFHFLSFFLFEYSSISFTFVIARILCYFLPFWFFFTISSFIWMASFLPLFSWCHG